MSPGLRMDAANREEPRGTTACHACGEEIDASDRYCRHCARPQQPRVAAWYHRPLWILVLALTVLGPFALPLVCRSPLLSRRAKWLLSAAILIVTVVAAYGCWRAGLAMVEAWKRVISELGGAGAF
jgi:hypothetical protein